MSATICILADTCGYVEGGGHLWAYLNWALGLRALGCDVIWLEVIDDDAGTETTRANVLALRTRLARYGLEKTFALCRESGAPLPGALADTVLDLGAATAADLLLNLRCRTSQALVKKFRRTALVDIDPGLLQVWMRAGSIKLAPHDIYFTIGETVGQSGSPIPDVGVRWVHTPPCVALDAWPVMPAEADAPFTTVSHWYADEWVEDGAEVYANDKRSGFLPFLDLPQRTRQPLELALCLGEAATEERDDLLRRGWRVREAVEVAATPWDYQRYVQQSRGEFGCAKPSCLRLQNAWVSDRSLCYLASGKPVVVQHTGPSRFLPHDAGMFRFRTLAEAARSLETVAADYPRQSRQARALAEEFFDARVVVNRVLERALP